MACAMCHYPELFNLDLRGIFLGSPLILILNSVTHTPPPLPPSSHWLTILRAGKERLIFWKTFKGVKVQPLIQGHELPGDGLGVGTSV
jgi:hypothetical protein